MTALLQLRDAIAAALAADQRLQALRVTVSVHGGDFGIEDLKQYGKNAPAVILSLLHADVEEQPGGENWADTVFGIVVLTKPRPPLSEDDAAIQVVDATLRAVRGSWWGELNVRAPERVTARNLFSPGIDKLGVAMWAIGFHQLVQLLDEDSTVWWERWHATYDPIETDPDRPHMEDEGEFAPP